MQELFDIPEEYENMLQQGIGLTGNDRHFFIKGRFDFLMGRESAFLQTEKILDFGCGTGEGAAELAKRFPESQVYAYDPSEKALEFARNRHSSERLHFVSKEPLGKIRFDLIFLNCVLHHVEPEKRQEEVKFLAGLLHPEGRIWIFENNPANPGTRWAMYRNPFDKGVKKIWPSGLQKMLRKAGLEIRDQGFLFYFPQWLAFLRPLERFLTAVPMGGQYALMAALPTFKKLP